MKERGPVHVWLSQAGASCYATRSIAETLHLLGEPSSLHREKQGKQGTHVHVRTRGSAHLGCPALAAVKKVSVEVL
eukprot:2446466-Amphidinium_carterae.1